MIRSKQRSYEVLMVFNPNTPDAALEERIKKVEEVCKAHGGSLDKKEVWGRRSLAYTISNYKYGLFVALNVSGVGSLVTDLSRQMKLMDEVLRSTVMTKNQYSPDLDGRLKGDFTYGYRPTSNAAASSLDPEVEDPDDKLDADLAVVV